MKKTAIQKLIESITKGGIIIINQDVIDEALKEEKENICKAYTDGLIGWDDEQTDEEYYNETFDVKL